MSNAKTFIHMVNLAHKHIAHKIKNDQIRKAIAKRNYNLINNPEMFFMKIVSGNEGKRAWLTNTDGTSYTDTDNKLHIQTQFWEQLYNKPTQPKNLDHWYPD